MLSAPYATPQRVVSTISYLQKLGNFKMIFGYCHNGTTEARFVSALRTLHPSASVRCRYSSG
jgi:hypothetical protein